MTEPRKVVVFNVRHEEYAISVESIISIEKMAEVTPIPHLPKYVRGIIKVREELIPVVDLEQIFYGQMTLDSESTRIIVLRTEEMLLGILVREAKEIIDILPEQVKQLGFVAYEKTSYFTGVANLNSRLITIVDPSILIRSLEGIKEIQEYMMNQLQK